MAEQRRHAEHSETVEGRERVRSSNRSSQWVCSTTRWIQGSRGDRTPSSMVTAAALQWWRSGVWHVCGLNRPTVTPVSTTTTWEAKNCGRAVVRLPGSCWPRWIELRRRWRGVVVEERRRSRFLWGEAMRVALGDAQGQGNAVHARNWKEKLRRRRIWRAGEARRRRAKREEEEEDDGSVGYLTVRDDSSGFASSWLSSPRVQLRVTARVRGEKGGGSSTSSSVASCLPTPEPDWNGSVSPSFSLDSIQQLAILQEQNLFTIVPTPSLL